MSFHRLTLDVSSGRSLNDNDEDNVNHDDEKTFFDTMRKYKNLMDNADDGFTLFFADAHYDTYDAALLIRQLHIVGLLFFSLSPNEKWKNILPLARGSQR